MNIRAAFSTFDQSGHLHIRAPISNFSSSNKWTGNVLTECAFTSGSTQAKLKICSKVYFEGHIPLAQHLTYSAVLRSGIRSVEVCLSSRIRNVPGSSPGESRFRVRLAIAYSLSGPIVLTFIDLS